MTIKSFVQDKKRRQLPQLPKVLRMEVVERIVNVMKTLERNGKLYGMNDILTIE